MRLHKAALAAAALVARAVYADESSAPSAPIARPNFTPSTITAEFVEQFTDDWASRWKPSHAKKDMAGSSQDAATDEWAYVGEWSVEEPVVLPGILGDKGLVVKNAAAHHAISAKFPKKIDPTGKTLVVQYEVKLQDGLNCGGAYLKLLRENKALHQEEFANTTPYVLMFGPDKCGHTNKVHFIFNHKNPVTGEYEEKHLSSPPTARDVKTTELYTLIIKPDNTFVIKQNGEEVKSGSLLEDFAPSVMPAAEIDDPSDSKPADWVEEARIADPAAAKPADWDEAAPYEIVDEDATVPDDWLEAEPLSVPDPDAAKPEDWDDDEDGDWIPPTVPNPACADVSGCGPWTKPMKKNPAYKGKWSAPFIDNPAYKGKWSPRKIANPDYFEDKTPANLEPMGAIGFEIWTMQKDILFDNIYIGHSIEDADAFARETFHVKHPIEKAEQDANKAKDKPKSESGSGLKFTDDPVRFMQQKLELFLAVVQQDPIQAFSMVPEVGAALVSLVAVALAIIYSLVSALGAPAVEDVKKAAAQAKDKVVELKDNVAEAAATGAETAKAEVAKRTGKGQQPQQQQS